MSDWIRIQLVACVLASIPIGCIATAQEALPADHGPLTTQWATQGSTLISNALFGDSGEYGNHIYQVQRNETQFLFTALARAYFVDDQRLQWSGQEQTFGAEGVLGGAVLRQINDWDVGFETELFLNQPFDRNILVDEPWRASYRENFEIETLEISQLFIEASRGDWSFSLGKRWTPFGRIWFPLNTNQLYDAPFIRTEVINWRETGLRMDYTPGIWDTSLSLVNGSEDMDTNSSKAMVARVGIDGGWFVLGGSAKWQDGIGSEGQKYRDNYVGLDAMFCRGRWSLSGEVTYDEYGFRRYFVPTDITWSRSIYGRDQYSADRLRGVGYYLNLNYQGDKWTTVLNYGSYHPQVFTGDHIHDRATQRGYAKFIRHMGQGLSNVTTILFENNVPNAQANRKRYGFMVYTGFEYRF